MAKYIYIFLGAGFGALARYILAGVVEFHINSLFPYGTLVVNIVGSFFIGFLWSVFRVISITPEIRSLIFVGILGGFTTFSSFMFESMNLLKDGEYIYGIANVLLANIIGLTAVFFGFKLGDLIVK
jgi:CrcB protein